MLEGARVRHQVCQAFSGAPPRHQGQCLGKPDGSIQLCMSWHRKLQSHRKPQSCPDLAVFKEKPAAVQKRARARQQIQSTAQNTVISFFYSHSPVNKANFLEVQGRPLEKRQAAARRMALRSPLALLGCYVCFG